MKKRPEGREAIWRKEKSNIVGKKCYCSKYHYSSKVHCYLLVIQIKNLFHLHTHNRYYHHSWYCHGKAGGKRGKKAKTTHTKHPNRMPKVQATTSYKKRKKIIYTDNQGEQGKQYLGYTQQPEKNNSLEDITIRRVSLFTD